MHRHRPPRVHALIAGVALVATIGCQPTPSSGPADSPYSDRYTLRDAPPVEHSAPAATPSTTAPAAPPAAAPAATSVWNTPISQLTPGDPRWAERLCKYGDVWGSCGDRWSTQMLGDPGEDYGVPVYDLRTATRQLKVRRKNPAFWAGVFNIPANATVPFNPTAWRPSSGKDAYMVIRDHENGHEWGFWNVSWWGHQTDVNNSLHCDPILGGNGLNLPAPFGAGWDPSSMLCAASAYQVRDPQGRPVDTRTWKGNFPGASGGGWQLGPLIVTPDEVASGRITHALHFVSANTMDGPACPPNRRHEIGETCGGAVAPAGQLEKVYYDGQPLAHQVPEGTRFSIDVTDAEIEAWLNSRGYTGTLRQTARTIAVALRDYGWFLGDSSPTSASWVFDTSPAARQQWKAMGVPGDGKALLKGLVKPTNIRSWAPPTMTCADGTKSQWYCWAIDGSY